MPEFRTLLTVVLGAALGVLFLLYPDAVLRIHAVGRVPPDRGGGYGSDSSSDRRWRRAVQVVGGAILAGSLYVGTTAGLTV